ncbi:MAG: glycosyltransferase family 39 protein [Bryobacteraceae bacterium]
MKLPLRMGVALMLGLLFAANCYRAATQAVTHDEALTWQIYLDAPVSNIFDVYDANHHFLATILERLSTGLFGTSELSLRLPSLLAGALFFLAVYRLAFLIFGGGWLVPLAVLLMAANPLVLDFLVAARGYGLALALFFYSLLKMVECLARRGRRDLYLAGTALALAPAANLTLLVPALVLAALFGYLLWRAPAPAVPAKRTKKHALPAAAPRLRHFVLPLGAVALLFFLAAPFSKAHLSDFYVGTDSPAASVRNLIACSFAYHDSANSVLAGWRAALAILPPAVALLAAALGAARVFRAGRERKPPVLPDAVLFLAGGAMAGSAALLVALHYAVDMPYPSDRTGLYFLPLAGLALATLAKSAGRIPGLAAAVVGALIAAQYLVQWNTSSFYVWRYEADSKRILELVEGAPRGTAPLRAGISWQLEPAFNFYRTVRRWTWLAPFDRSGPDGDYDIYVLISNDGALVARRALRVLYRGRVSGTVLAAPGQPRAGNW